MIKNTMMNTITLPQNWLFLLCVVFLIILVSHGVISATWKNYYRKVPLGRLTHSQLRVKQGNATAEQRLNVFAHRIALSLFQFRSYLFTLVCWVILVALHHFELLTF